MYLVASLNTHLRAWTEADLNNHRDGFHSGYRKRGGQIHLEYKLPGMQDIYCDILD